MSAVDVLRVMRKGEAYCRDAGDTNAANAMKDARAAVAELIEVNQELQFIRNNGCASRTFDSVTTRHDAALARVRGES